MVFNCHSIEEVKSLINNDPFIKEKYYEAYDIQEFLEANDENNWLIIIPQTQGN